MAEAEPGALANDASDPAGHRVRIAIAGRDVDHFARPEDAAARARLLLGEGRSVLELPVRGELVFERDSRWASASRRRPRADVGVAHHEVTSVGR